MKNGKTIKQIADEIGVSKQAVSYRLKQIQTAKKDMFLATKENGVLVVSLAAEKLIKQAFLEKDRRQKEPSTDNQKEDDVLAVLKATIDALQGQLKVKDKRIDELTDELAKEREYGREREKEIAVLADQAQKLQLAQMKQQQPLLPGEEAALQEEQPKKKRLLEKFFGCWS